MEKILYIIVIIIAGPLALHIIIQHFRVNKFRATCKPLDRCHVYAGEIRCPGLILSIDRAADIVIVTFLHPEIYGHQPTEQKSIFDIYP